MYPSKENKRASLKKHKNFKLKPVLSWKTRIFDIKQLKADTPVGYGCTYRTTKNTKMALIPVGYYEGLDRGLSNNGWVIIKNQKCPIIANVCMNITMINVSKIKDVKIGDEVILMGQSKNNCVFADDIANTLGTINYEITTRLNDNILRILK